MFSTFVLSALALSGQALAVNFTSTSPADVAAARDSALTLSPTSKVHGRAFDRFVTIWLENTDFDKAASDPNLAWRATKGITLSNYNGVTHPSEPNYVASIGGDNFGMDNDDFNQIPGNISSIIDLLEDRGISWSQYQQDMPYSGFEGKAWVNQQTQANVYVRKHNPAVIYDANTSPERLAKNKNLTEFYSDLEAKKLPQWMFITPNMTNDGHDSSVTTAGAWTRSFLEPLLNDHHFMHNTLVLITFDESHTYTIQNRVFSILLGDAVPKKLVGTTDSQYYNHYSEISTVEANWDLSTLGRWDVGANIFSFVAEQTGDVNTPWPAASGSNSSHFFNSSFAGPFSDADRVATLPVPNTKLVRNGRTVLGKIARTWGGASLQNQTYYQNTVQIPDGMHPPQGWAI
ncbi:acid phosphatase phoa, partial [Aureobasidium melanogenum]